LAKSSCNGRANIAKRIKKRRNKSVVIASRLSGGVAI
jgi:hypothetical protein